ncbi:nucleoside triphosphate pyrophosphohydrolase family protein [Prosthecomicrobium hirschii]|uniref:nucleoside triphosphate pyrophosphohydrolase family protein n=1 Tax=Prosthecodimorpha hirschii TaxID=665126 RepID=UPI00221F69E1|nr:nucleoside triphosphate pyrophosphohydrolase family protein [Prosthecomicrobium hirschii]MCW1838755.1 nucleoside triphosphate pyrophosphohydrolase family protein [Prosthecomicrobium hirschii]
MDGSTLSLNEYQLLAAQTDRTKSSASNLALPILGLFGETGSLLSEVKKKQRDARSYDSYEKGVVEEFGDALWYLAVIAANANITFQELASNFGAGADSPLRFADLQPQKTLPLGAPTTEFSRTLLKLANSVGNLIDSNGKVISILDLTSLRAQLTLIFGNLVNAATEAGVTLGDAAVFNIQKSRDRWPIDRTPPPLFDIEFPPEEQLPRQLEVEIFERSSNGKQYVYQRCNGVNIGDRLTDNNIVEDFYRFHDAFHYAYAAVLGWSPVTRALLKLKRKSKTKVDDGEDGARAIILEEGVAAYVFARAKEHDFFEGRKEIDFNLLKTVRSFVHGFEAEKCPLWLWEEAILQGNAAYRFLRAHRRGRIILNLQKREMSIREMAP